MKKGYEANEGLGRDPPICQRPECKTATAADPRKQAHSNPVKSTKLLPMQLSQSAVAAVVFSNSMTSRGLKSDNKKQLQ